MFKIEVLDIRLETLMIRFYLMMAVIIAAGFMNMWGFALLGLPIFLSALLGIRFTTKNAKPQTSMKKMTPRKEKNVA